MDQDRKHNWGNEIEDHPATQEDPDNSDAIEDAAGLRDWANPLHDARGT